MSDIAGFQLLLGRLLGDVYSAGAGTYFTATARTPGELTEFRELPEERGIDRACHLPLAPRPVTPRVVRW